MIGLPPFGARMKVWPAPGLKVQDGPRPVGDGGRWLAAEGAVVVWDAFRLEQYRAGELLLHAPPVEKKTEKKAEPPPLFDPHKATADHMEAITPKPAEEEAGEEKEPAPKGDEIAKEAEEPKAEAPKGDETPAKSTDTGSAR